MDEQFMVSYASYRSYGDYGVLVERWESTARVAFMVEIDRWDAAADEALPVTAYVRLDRPDRPLYAYEVYAEACALIEQEEGTR